MWNICSVKKPPTKAGVFFFEDFDDTEALDIVVEPALILQKLIQFLLAPVSARGMPEVVGEGDRLRQILVETQRPRDRSRSA